jgi:hypothetical protein
MVGMSQPSIVKIETDSRANIELRLLWDFADALGVKPAHFMRACQRTVEEEKAQYFSPSRSFWKPNAAINYQNKRAFMTGKTWRVQLDASHTPYAHVDFKRSHEHANGYMVVLVDVERFMACFDRDRFVIGRPTEWSEAKREGLRQFLDPKEGACDMPVIGFSIRTTEHRRLFGLLANRIEKVPVAGFTNGRHRARYLQHAGAKVMPVEVHESQAALLRQHCGASWNWTIGAAGRGRQKRKANYE